VPICFLRDRRIFALIWQLSNGVLKRFQLLGEGRGYVLYISVIVAFCAHSYRRLAYLTVASTLATHLFKEKETPAGRRYTHVSTYNVRTPVSFLFHIYQSTLVISFAGDFLFFLFFFFFSIPYFFFS
jgi:hypothetical protein